MKMKDAIKLGIGFYFGKEIYNFVSEVIAGVIAMNSGKIQDYILDREKTDSSRKAMKDKFCKHYKGTKYKDQTVTNKKNPIGFV